MCIAFPVWLDRAVQLVPCELLAFDIRAEIIFTRRRGQVSIVTAGFSVAINSRKNLQVFSNMPPVYWLSMACNIYETMELKAAPKFSKYPRG